MRNNRTRQQSRYSLNRKEISERSQEIFESMNRADPSTDLTASEEFLFLQLLRAMPADFLRAKLPLIFRVKPNALCSCGLCNTCKNRRKVQTRRARLQTLDKENPFGITAEEIPLTDLGRKRKVEIMSEYQSLLQEQREAADQSTRVRAGKLMAKLRKEFEENS